MAGGANKVDERPQGYWRIPSLFPELGAETLEKLQQYYSQIINMNGKLDLIPKRTELEADVHHFADAIIGCRLVLTERTSHNIYDIGSGNGLPGIVMALLAPDRNLALVEVDERKCEFLKVIIDRLNLKNAIVMRTRFEALKDDSIECAVSRGFGRLSKTLMVSRKPMAPNGEYFHFKGGGWVREVAEIPSQIMSFWTPRLIKEYTLPEVGGSLAIVCTKRVQR